MSLGNNFTGLEKSNDNTCIYCGSVIPEGLIVCKLCEGELIKKATKRKDLKVLLNSLNLGFSNVLGVTVYKTVGNKYKVTTYKEGSVCLDLDKAVDVLCNSIQNK